MKLGYGISLAGSNQRSFATAQAGSSLAAPYAWWAADNGVTQQDGYVIEWLDKSGNNRTLFPSGDYGPVYYSSIINSKPALFFIYDQKAGIYSALVQASSDSTTIRSIIAVAKPASDVTQYSCIVECSGGGLYSCVFNDQKAGLLYWGSYFSFANYGDYVYPQEPAIFAYSANSAGTSIYQVKKDAIDGEVSQTVAGGGNTSRSDITVGTDSTFQQPARSYLSELVLFDYQLTTEQLNGYISLFSTKYAI